MSWGRTKGGECNGHGSDQAWGSDRSKGWIPAGKRARSEYAVPPVPKSQGLEPQWSSYLTVHQYKDLIASVRSDVWSQCTKAFEAHLREHGATPLPQDGHGTGSTWPTRNQGYQGDPAADLELSPAKDPEDATEAAADIGVSSGGEGAVELSLECVGFGAPPDGYMLKFVGFQPTYGELRMWVAEELWLPLDRFSVLLLGREDYHTGHRLRCQD